MFNKNFGFGLMRLPMLGEEIDFLQVNKMVDTLMENGFNYFDTAHTYIKGKSEIAVKECISKRYKREDFILTDKISGWCFETEEDIDGYFSDMLNACGVEYFDFLLMHSQNRINFDHFKQCRAYEKAFEYKEKGLVKFVGISFHDMPEVLDRILTEYPQLDIVQIQFNYLDTDNPSCESMGCYEVCRKHKKPMIVMEPVRGGRLVNIPQNAKKVFEEMGNMSPASYALRYAASFEGIKMVISGMSNMEQVLDNVSFMKDFTPLSEDEHRAVQRVKEIIKEEELIGCTNCRYCVEGCPKNILIPDIFEAYNSTKRGENGEEKFLKATENNGKASDCIRCGKCERVCPQYIDIRKFLKFSAEKFEK